MNRILFSLLGLAAWTTAIGSLVYILGSTADFAFPFRAKYIRNLTLVRVHGVSAALTLLLGPLQWLWPRGGAHRMRGYLYLVSVLIGGATGLWLGFGAFGGLVSKSGFVLVALLWWYTGWQAYSAARKRDFALHRIWMIRNFALAFGAVALRAYLEVGQIMGFDFYALYPTSVWASWLPCMALAEWRVSALQELEGPAPVSR